MTFNCVQVPGDQIRTFLAPSIVREPSSGPNLSVMKVYGGLTKQKFTNDVCLSQVANVHNGGGGGVRTVYLYYLIL